MRWMALLAIASCGAPHPDAVPVKATVETEPVPHGGDAADDPAIWVHPTDPAKSLVIGTDKQGGLAVYDLSGKQLQYLADGKMNNVDVRGNLVVAGNRSDNTIVSYRVDPEKRTLEKSGTRKAEIEIYGSCLYKSDKSGKVYAFVCSKKGQVEQWDLETGKLARSFDVGSQCEGCVADDELGRFYISEESVGIWKYGAEPDDKAERIQVDSTRGHLTADAEGLAIYIGPKGTGYLVASSQGADAFVIYRREGKNEYLMTFKVVDGAVDGCSGTDGIDVTSAALGDAFPKGLFVAQDGKNDKGNQNFKLVPWQDIAGHLK